MLKILMFPLLAFSLVACSEQQTETANVDTAVENTQESQSAVQPSAKTPVQPVAASPSASTNIVAGGVVDAGSAKDRVPTKEKSMSKGLLDAKLLVNDKANVTLQYTNNQRYGVPLMFISGMTADLWLLDPSGHRVWAWSNEMMFTQALRETVMPAGKTQNVKFTIPASVAAKITKGYSLKALFAGKATESQTPAMLPVTYQYTM
ncbi:BsuPI-related putative proteinase inhibitor [Shewanella sp. 0m-8]